MIFRKKFLSFSLAMVLSCIATAQTSSSKPNILFCIADDASWQHMSAYKKQNWVHTPAFDKVAENGLLFMNAYTPNAKCAPSRACILTGRNPWQLEAAGNHNAYFPARFMSVMEVLQQQGYATAFTGKGWGPGDPGRYPDGKARLLTGAEKNRKKLTPPTKEISHTDYAANFEDFLNSRPKGQPFMFWFGSHEPHRKYEYNSGNKFGNKNLTDIESIPPFWIDNDITRTDLLDYAYEVEYFDKQLEKILSVLEKYNQMENTIVIVTSDNGMPFPRVKGHLYEYDNHLPLAIMWKGHIANTGRQIQDYVSFIDFAPTFLEIAEVPQKQSKMQPIQGRSLMNIINSKNGTTIDKTRSYVLLGREREDVGRPNDEGYPERAIVKDGFFFVRNYEPTRWPSGNPETGYMDTDGSPAKTEILAANRKGLFTNAWQMSFGKRPEYELYDVGRDPYLIHNLHGESKYKNIAQDLLKQMEALLKQQGDPRMFGKGYIFDKYPYAQEKVKNYYERYMKGEKIPAGWIEAGDFETKIIKD